VIGNSRIPSPPERTTAVRTLFRSLRNEILESSLEGLSIRIPYYACTQCGVLGRSERASLPRVDFRRGYFDFSSERHLFAILKAGPALVAKYDRVLVR